MKGSHKSYCFPFRRQIAAHFYALPEYFGQLKVLAHQICFCAADIICIKIQTAYTEPSVGTKTLKHLVSLGLDHNSEVGLLKSQVRIPHVFELVILRARPSRHRLFVITKTSSVRKTIVMQA